MTNFKNNKQKNGSVKTIIIIVCSIVAVLLIGLFVLAAVENNDDSIPHSDCSGNPIFCGVDKPIIYLYPEKETELTVKLGKPENLTASYPTYQEEGWRVLARPDGTLTNLNTGRSLYSLYWEGKNDTAPDFSEGFLVSGKDTVPFLEEKLSALGLTEREAEEFIVYWLPKMQNNPYNLIRFESLEEINEFMPLDFSVEPDTLIRVMMVYKPLDNPINIKEQSLPEPPARKGFTVVEWGGSEIK